MNTTISIIVPVHNSEAHLEQCLESIMKQTFRDFELLLINDGSTDHSGNICDNYAKQDQRIKVFHICNSGVSSARNLGIIEASGDWITFIDSDDWISENFIQELYKTSQIEKNIDFVHGGCTNFHSDQTYTIEQKYSNELSSNIGDLVNNARGLIVSKFFRREIIKSNKIYFDTDMKIAEDMLFTLEYCRYVKLYAFSGETGYYYRRHPESATTKKRERDYHSQYSRLLKIYNALQYYTSVRKISTYDIKNKLQALSRDLLSTIKSLYLKREGFNDYRLMLVANFSQYNIISILKFHHNRLVKLLPYLSFDKNLHLLNFILYSYVKMEFHLKQLIRQS